MDDSAPLPRYLHGYSPKEQARLVEQDPDLIDLIGRHCQNDETDRVRRA